MEVFLTAVQRDEAVASADIDIELIRSLAHPIESQCALGLEIISIGKVYPFRAGSERSPVGDSLNPTVCELSPPMVVFFCQSPKQRVD